MSIVVGQQFGFWKVLELPEKGHYFKCLCTGCNSAEKSIRKWTLLRGESKSCGCQLVENIKKTNVEKYGTEWTQQVEQVKEKSKQTCLEKYGVDNYAKTKEKKDKTKKTCLEKYGVDHHKKKRPKPSYGGLSYGKPTS